MVKIEQTRRTYSGLRRYLATTNHPHLYFFLVLLRRLPPYLILRLVVVFVVVVVAILVMQARHKVSSSLSAAQTAQASLTAGEKPSHSEETDTVTS